MPDTPIAIGQDSADTPATEFSMLRLIADSVPALIAYFEVGTLVCRFANQRYASYNGHSPQSIVGKTVLQAIGDAAWTAIQPHVDRTVRGEQVQYVRAQTLPSGAQRMIEVNLIPHFNDAGTQLGVFVLINDITHHWHSERLVRESEERMRKFAEATTEAIVRLVFLASASCFVIGLHLMNSPYIDKFVLDESGEQISELVKAVTGRHFPEPETTLRFGTKLTTLVTLREGYCEFDRPAAWATSHNRSLQT